jgi:hypothetical protein
MTSVDARLHGDECCWIPAFAGMTGEAQGLETFPFLKLPEGIDDFEKRKPVKIRITSVDLGGRRIIKKNCRVSIKEKITCKQRNFIEGLRGDL